MIKMADTPVSAALSSITLDCVRDYIRKESQQFEFGHSSDELEEWLTNMDKEVWHNDVRRYRTHVEELVKKFKEVSVEIRLIRDFWSLGEGEEGL